ncbi:MAG: Thiosulfate sulfurtransferase GlpE [Flavobacterium sp. SCGC AAA160-P02]|nr:MAG: Thiosulfate sulfurtransferase GlpE [Flavobacterium sp. SCGC AAA160-P02]|tara:strand:+ start:398 stop:775 length:378 start_codon:yes stop_codon:yes gene_type:complete
MNLVRNLFFILFILTCFNSCTQKVENLKVISQEVFSKLPTTNIQLLDVRTPREFQEGFIEGATLINFYDTDFVTKVHSKFDKNRPLYIYCAVGSRSKEAGYNLVLEGFTEIYNLKGGYIGYQKYN